MIHALKCPTCAAPVDFDDKSDSRTMRCPFCQNTIIVPDALRQGVVSTFGARPRTLRVGPGMKYFLVFSVCAIILGSIYAVMQIVNTAIRSGENKTPPRAIIIPPIPAFPPIPKTAEATPTPPGFATTTLKFGSEGTGPGTFNDARSIAVDGDGRIYVGDYTGGRVQVFDAAGKFQTQWMVDQKMPLRGMAADRRGNIYVVQSGTIQRYEAASGKPLGELSYGEGRGFDNVVTTPDGGLVAAWRRNRDDIVRFDANGRLVKVIRSAVSGQTDASELDLRVAVDGLGNIYALGTFTQAVYKFTPDGRFVNRFGGRGDQPGQLHAPQSIAVDNQGRVYVSDIKGVQVFDKEGRYIDVFKPASIAFGMVFDDKNELHIAARSQVLKCSLNEKK
ncbi:MAG: NHL repeat-containing protein [Acidobacteria bacterium]|nr:NHL repeat-containing protein [Acidobacteriota bacterium]